MTLKFHTEFFLSLCIPAYFTHLVKPNVFYTEMFMHKILLYQTNFLAIPGLKFICFQLFLIRILCESTFLQFIHKNTFIL